VNTSAQRERKLGCGGDANSESGGACIGRRGPETRRNESRQRQAVLPHSTQADTNARQVRGDWGGRSGPKGVRQWRLERLERLERPERKGQQMSSVLLDEQRERVRELGTRYPKGLGDAGDAGGCGEEQKRTTRRTS
jgi:hypothetical protein